VTFGVILTYSCSLATDTLNRTGLLSLWEQFMVWLCWNKGHNRPIR